MALLTEEFTYQIDHGQLHCLGRRRAWLRRSLTDQVGDLLTPRDRELLVLVAASPPGVDPGAAARHLSTCPDRRRDLLVCDLERDRAAGAVRGREVMGMDLLAARKDLAPKGLAVIESARTRMTTDPAIVWGASSDQSARTVGRCLKADLPGQATTLRVLTGERVVRYRVEPAPHPDATGPIHSTLLVRTE